MHFSGHVLFHFLDTNVKKSDTAQFDFLFLVPSVENVGFYTQLWQTLETLTTVKPNVTKSTVTV